jgi:hypothetical protein
VLEVVRILVSTCSDGLHTDTGKAAMSMCEEPGDIAPEVLGGEAAGEQDIQSSNPFFVSKKAAAVLKHALLEQYLVPFAAKVGSFARNKRVVYIDGYAGPGRYADGTMGSPALVLEQAKTLASFRTLECLFVERRRTDFARLQALIQEAQAAGISCDAYRGKVINHLDTLLQRAGEAPLFAFPGPVRPGHSV